MRAYTKLCQKFSLLEFQDLTHALMSMQCFIQVKVNLKKKNMVVPIEPGIRQCYDTLSVFLLHYLSSGRLQKAKNKGKFQTFSPKSGCGRLREVVASQEVANIVTRLGNF